MPFSRAREQGRRATGAPVQPAAALGPRSPDEIEEEQRHLRWAQPPHTRRAANSFGASRAPYPHDDAPTMPIRSGTACGGRDKATGRPAAGGRRRPIRMRTRERGREWGAGRRGGAEHVRDKSARSTRWDGQDFKRIRDGTRPETSASTRPRRGASGEGQSRSPNQAGRLQAFVQPLGIRKLSTRQRTSGNRIAP